MKLRIKGTSSEACEVEWIQRKRKKTYGGAGDYDDLAFKRG